MIRVNTSLSDIVVRGDGKHGSTDARVPVVPCSKASIVVNLKLAEKAGISYTEWSCDMVMMPRRPGTRDGACSLRAVAGYVGQR